MANNIFRKKSMDRVSSPESLNDYVRVTNPSVWVILTSIILLLVGVCVWGVFSHLDTKVVAGAVSDQNQTVCYIPEDKASQVKEGMTVRINGEEGTITSVSSVPIQLGKSDTYLTHVIGLEEGQWVCKVNCDIELEEGIYQAEIIIDSVSPMSFVMN